MSSVFNSEVVNLDGKWVTADNRRLWVFRELERLGKCDTIPVRISTYIPEAKLTSYNGGTSVRVRGPAGGYWHNKPTPYKSTVQSTLQISNKASAYQSGYKVKDLSERPALFSYQAPSVYRHQRRNHNRLYQHTWQLQQKPTLRWLLKPALNIHLNLRYVRLQTVSEPNLK